MTSSHCLFPRNYNYQPQRDNSEKSVFCLRSVMGFSAREMRVSTAIVAFRQKCKMSDTIHPSCKQQRTGEKNMERKTEKQTKILICAWKKCFTLFYFQSIITVTGCTI